MKEGRKKVGMCFFFVFLPLFPLYTPLLGVSPIRINVGVVWLNCRFFLSLFIWEGEYRHWYDRPVYKGGNELSYKERIFDALSKSSIRGSHVQKRNQK